MMQRGLLNTSMNIGAGVEAGENALYEKALPIAQADAQTYKEASTNTTNADNAAKYAKMQADNAAAMRGAELGTNVNLANADASTKADATTAGAANQFKQTGLETYRALELSDRDTIRALQLADKEFERAMGTAQLDAQTRVQLAAMDHNTRMDLAQVDRNTRVELTSIENNYRQLLQMNSDLATMYNQVSTNIANISMSNLDPKAKEDATLSQLNVLKEALRAKQGVAGTPGHTSANPAGTSPVVSALNIGQFFPNPTASGGQEFDQAGYDRALAAWNERQASHTARYGVPIKPSEPGWTPPKRSDFEGGPVTFGGRPATPPASTGTTNGGTPSPSTTPGSPAPSGGGPAPAVPAIPPNGTPAPMYGPGAYTYWDGFGTQHLVRPGQGDTRIGGR
jgi:hypothetical protein